MGSQAELEEASEGGGDGEGDALRCLGEGGSIPSLAPWCDLEEDVGRRRSKFNRSLAD